MRQQRRARGAVQGRGDKSLQTIIGGTNLQTTLERLQIAGDHGQQIVEVVCDPTGELADRLHLLRMAELCLCLTPLGEIAGYLGKAE